MPWKKAIHVLQNPVEAYLGAHAMLNLELIFHNENRVK